MPPQSSLSYEDHVKQTLTRSMAPRSNLRSVQIFLHKLQKQQEGGEVMSRLQLQLKGRRLMARL